MRVLFRLLQVVSILLLFVVTVSACQTYLFRMYVDFPCFVEYDEAKQCLDVSNYYGPPLAEQPALEVYLSRFEASSNGAWCSYESAAQGELIEMGGPLGTLEFTREGDGLVLNGMPLMAGEPYERSSFLILNPWATGKVKITSYGLVSPCGGGSPRLAAIGWAGTRPSVEKGAIVTVLLLTMSILFGRLARKKKENPPGV